MINLLLSILGIKLIFSADIAKDCRASYGINGCYDAHANIIYLGPESDNAARTIYHELGHALFTGNSEAENLIAQYPALRHKSNSNEEKVADYFAEFMTQKERFKISYPLLDKYFKNKMSALEYFINSNPS